MTCFINFDPARGLSIATYRQPQGACNGDVLGLVEDIRAGRPGCCDLEGAKAALEDGSLWTDDDQETLELLHAAVSERAREIDEGVMP